jgi:hypothetical protein
MSDLTQEQRALRLAGLMADHALTLVGGMGLNGPIYPAHPDQFSDIAQDLRHAAETYNAHIIEMNRRE